MKEGKTLHGREDYGLNNSIQEHRTHVLKLPRRQNPMKFSRVDSRVRKFIKSDVSETDSVSIIRVLM